MPKTKFGFPGTRIRRAVATVCRVKKSGFFSDFSDFENAKCGQHACPERAYYDSPGREPWVAFPRCESNPEGVAYHGCSYAALSGLGSSLVCVPGLTHAERLVTIAKH